MTTFKLKRGLDIPISGAAENTTVAAKRPDLIHVVPDHFAGITPKIVVHEGDRVLAGQPLFHDKAHADMNITSPVSGTVVAIKRGERRKVMSVDVKPDSVTEYAHFDTAVTTAKEVRTLLLNSGLWTLIKQRPYDVVANPEATPKAIFISTFDTAPLAPDFEYTLRERKADLQAGIKALGLLAPVSLGVRKNAGELFLSLNGCEINTFDGPHPAGNVGVQINHVNPVNKGETVFTLGIQDLATIGRLMNEGIVVMKKTIALTGPMAVQPKYYTYTYGTPVSRMLGGQLEPGVTLRIVCGNILSGYHMEADEPLCPYCNQVTIIADGSDVDEMMGWMAPRFNKFSMNRTFLAGMLPCLNNKIDFNYDARILGSRRAIIMSGEYDKVFPMDIYPEYLIKAMIAGNIDRMEALGAYEVAPEDFALCEFVCTSKMPLQAIVRQALDNMRKELE